MPSVEHFKGGGSRAAAFTVTDFQDGGVGTYHKNTRIWYYLFFSRSEFLRPVQ